MVRFNRKLGLVECLFETLHSMGAMLYVNVAKVQGIVSCDVLRAAIDLLQKRHPLLQVHLQKLDDGFYFCSDSTLVIPLKIIERQHEQQWLEVAENELGKKFSGDFEPLCRITFLQSPEKLVSNEIIVTFHHAITDGISAIYCIHELLSFYQQLVEEASISPIVSLPLMPPLEQLLEACLSEPDASDQAQVTVSQVNLAPKLIVEQTAPINHRQTHLLPRELGQDLTSQIRTRCRDERTTVHGALCAAMLLACTRQISSEEPMLISCSSSINLRASCFPLVEPHHLGCFISNVTTTHHTGINTNFWELARECHSNIYQLVHSKIPHRQASSAELLSKYQPSFIAQLAEHNMGRNTTTHVSNLGQFDFKRSYGSVQLESFYFATGLSLVGTCFWLGAVTINQKLFCTFTYTDPLISLKTANSLADVVIIMLHDAILLPSM